MQGALAMWWGKPLIRRISSISSLCYQIQPIPVDFLLLSSRAEMILKDQLLVLLFFLMFALELILDPLQSGASLASE